MCAITRALSQAAVDMAYGETEPIGRKANSPLRAIFEQPTTIHSFNSFPWQRVWTEPGGREAGASQAVRSRAEPGNEIDPG